MTQTVGKLDRKFIYEFTALVGSNITNEDFNIEDICKTVFESKFGVTPKAFKEK